MREMDTETWWADTMAEARRQLNAIDPESLITDDLRTRINVAAGEIETLAREAKQLRERVESMWQEIGDLEDEEERLLDSKFQSDTPDWVQGLFGEMTGSEELWRGFHELLCVLHNAVPRYPNETLRERG